MRLKQKIKENGILFQLNLRMHGPVHSLAVDLPPRTHHSSQFGGFSCVAMTDNKLTEKCRKIFLN